MGAVYLERLGGVVMLGGVFDGKVGDGDQERAGDCR